jgi:hypothetical protein
MADIIVTVEEQGITSTVITEPTTTTFVTSNTTPPTTVDSLSTVGDVDTAELVNGSVLVYKTTTNKWTSTTTLEAQNMEGGEF